MNAAELRARAADRRERERIQPLFHVGLPEHANDLGVELVQDCIRRFRRRDDADPADRLETRVTRSAIVGRSGRNAERVSVPMPSPRSFPDLMCGSDAGIASNMIGTWPPITSACAAGLPLYGMWFNWIAAADMNISIVRWLVEPLPSEA